MSGRRENFLTGGYLLLPGQLIDEYNMGDDFFVAMVDLLQHLVRDFRESFSSISDERRNQGFFFHGQMVSFLYLILRRILPCRKLPKEDDWDKLKCFDFLRKDLLESEQFMLKTGFRDRALSVVKEHIDVEKTRGSGTCSAATAVINASCNPFLDACREFLKRVFEGLLQHPDWKTDLVVGLACFECCFLFELPKGQNIESFKHLRKSFSD